MHELLCKLARVEQIPQVELDVIEAPERRKELGYFADSPTKLSRPTVHTLDSRITVASRSAERSSQCELQFEFFLVPCTCFGKVIEKPSSR